MSMQLMSEKLLEIEIKKIEDTDMPEDRGFLYQLCKKELAVIKKLKINKIDLRGEIEETNRRIAENALYFMKPHEFEIMEEKAKKYDIISSIITKKENE